MSDSKGAPEGPDLREGVAAEDVREDACVRGHVDGEAALLVRLGDELFCVGATCTHYGGPLAEGLVVGDTIRCPWHHACFSLRTGAMLRPPALDPLPRWSVVVADGVARAGEKLEPADVDSGDVADPGADRGDALSSVVIVGGGAAGASAALGLREAGYAGPITIVSDDVDPPYDRPNASKDYLAGTAEEAWMPLRGDDGWAAHDVELRLDTRVVRLDSDAHRLTLEGGESLDYGALLVATGAEPIRLKDAGPAGDRIHYLRSWADSRRIIDAARDARSAVVVGASFIGLEVAASLRARDLKVYVVAPEEVPLGRVLGDELGGYVKRLHEKKGVRFHLGHTVASVEEDAVVLDDGRRIECDLVVAGIGVRPRVALLEEAGAEVDGGVVVDARLRTTLPDVWAAGDIAAWPDPHTGERIRVEHWVVAERQGRAAARSILGSDEPFDAVPFFWSQHYDVSINYVGHAGDWDVADLDGDPDENDCTVRYRRAGRVLAVASIFRDVESLEAEVALEGARAKGT